MTISSPLLPRYDTVARSLWKMMTTDANSLLPKHDNVNEKRHVTFCVFCLKLSLLVAILCLPEIAFAHGIEGKDADFLNKNDGINIPIFLYLGAKHMVTGYDHLLFLFGIIFLLHRFRDIALYVTLFALGHSITLMYGVLAHININAFLVDAIIGFSVVYKAFDNLGGFRKWRFAPNPKWAVLLFGFCHGFGLASKLQDFALSRDGLVINMVAFNIGVELGQFVALVAMLLVISLWRKTASFKGYAIGTNVLLMFLGFLLTGYQLTHYFWSTVS